MLRRVLAAVFCLLLLYSQTRLFDIVQYEAALPLTEDRLARIETAGRNTGKSSVSVRAGEVWLGFGNNMAGAQWYWCTGNAMESNGYRLTAGQWPADGQGDEQFVALQQDLAQKFSPDPQTLLGRSISIYGEEYIVVGLFAHNDWLPARTERMAIVTPYTGQETTGVIEFQFRSGYAALYRDYIADALGASAVNDIDRCARINACLLGLCLFILTITPAKMVLQWQREMWKGLKEEIFARQKTQYWPQTVRQIAPRALGMAFLSGAAAVLFGGVWLWLGRYIYVPQALLSYDLRSLSRIVDTVYDYAVMQNGMRSIMTARWAGVRCMRMIALILPGCMAAIGLQKANTAHKHVENDSDKV